MIVHYDITEAELSSKPFEAGAMYFCNDSGNVYIDSVAESARILMSSEVKILGTEIERTSILAPIPNKIYCVLDSGKMYIYSSGAWVALGITQFEISDVILDSSPATISDTRIKAANTAAFVPDLSVRDLVTINNVSCANGSATVIYTASYPITGRLIVN